MNVHFTTTSILAKHMLIVIIVWQYIVNHSSAVVNLMYSHSSNRGFEPWAKQSHNMICYALNEVQFTSDESSIELALY